MSLQYEFGSDYFDGFKNLVLFCYFSFVFGAFNMQQVVLEFFLAAFAVGVSGLGNKQYLLLNRHVFSLLDKFLMTFLINLIFYINLVVGQNKGVS